MSGADAAGLQQLRAQLLPLTDYIPLWVKIAVAVALGLGTMVGWKRIVVTVGEKIGLSHLTYAQGASAELVTMSTIGLADVVGLPVSTTHILSSGIAGAMYANHSGLQKATLRNIVLASAYDAAIDGTGVGARHLLAAAVREYAKLGRRPPVGLV